VNASREVPALGADDRAAPIPPKPSLMAAGIGNRLLGALLAIALLGLAVAWALQ
jgi:hypothetical protein